jgi:hypothetical protein
MYTTAASLLERMRQPSAAQAWERFVEDVPPPCGPRVLRTHVGRRPQHLPVHLATKQ